MPEQVVSVGAGFPRTAPGYASKRRSMERWTQDGVRKHTLIRPKLRKKERNNLRETIQRVVDGDVTACEALENR